MFLFIFAGLPLYISRHFSLTSCLSLSHIVFALYSIMYLSFSVCLPIPLYSSLSLFFSLLTCCRPPAVPPRTVRGLKNEQWWPSSPWGWPPGPCSPCAAPPVPEHAIFIREVSLIVTDFTVSGNGSSCKYLFFVSFYFILTLSLFGGTPSCLEDDNK